jgi:plasmid stabilization system protein ParE
VTRAVRFEAEAEDELLDAARWYERQRSGFGRSFLQAVATTVEAAWKAPHRFPLVCDVAEELGVRHARVSRFPYSVVFLEVQEVLRVLAVAHERRRPGYWRSRV